MRTLDLLRTSILCVALTPVVAVAAPKPILPPSVESIRTQYLEGLFKAKPHLATFMGEHKYDGKLPDHSPAANTARIRELEKLQKSLAALKPEADRRKSVTMQLVALPKYLEVEMKALSTGKHHPAKVMLDSAIKGNKGRIEFFETEIKAFTEKDGKGEAARVKAVAALKKFQTFLETKLGKRADGEWRLGVDLYAKKFPLALQTTLTPDQLVPRAEQAFADAKKKLYEVSRRLHGQLWPKEPMPAATATAEVQKKTIERVKEQLSKDHPKPDELVASHGKNLDKLREFIVKHDLLALPPKETLTVEPMPLFKRGSSGAEYLAPGVLMKGDTWKATYFVDPIDPTWPADKVESYLRGQNDYAVQLVASHEAYPGHHTQYSYARKELDPVRAVLWNAAFVEGWAVYGEGLMVELGWGDKANDRFKFYELRGQMIVATNAILDVKLQSGKMTDDEAVKFMVEQGFQEQAMAEKKLLRAKLDSTQLCQYFLGLSEIQELERDYRKQVGAKFKQRTFNEGLISHGSIAVKFLRQFLLTVKS